MIIQCPSCGYQYDASEIFFPDAVFGEPRFIKRNDQGKIQCIVGNKSNLDESYQCDSCGSYFNCHVDIAVSSYVSEPYTTRLK